MHETNGREGKLPHGGGSSGGQIEPSVVT